MTSFETIKIKDKCFKEYISHKEIQKIVKQTATNINEFYENVTNEDNPLIIIGVLNGSFMFLADLVKHINLACQIHFIKVSSYEGTDTTGKVTNIIGLTKDITDNHVLIIEDIIDTGITIDNLMNALSSKNPSTLNACSMLFKSDKYNGKTIIKKKFIGKTIPNDFVVGYGLDYDQFGRNYEDIYSIVE